MEAPRVLTAQEERQLKLLEYLAAKGKLKPQNNSKPYLKDCTNLQNKRPRQVSRQICEKRDVFHKGTQFGFQENKNRTSKTASLPYRAKTGKIPAQQSILDSRFGNKTLSRIPVPSKLGLPRARPDQPDRSVKTKSRDIVKSVAGKTLSSAAPESCENEAERCDEADGRSTVILSLSRHVEKHEICPREKTSLSHRRPAASGDVTTIRSKCTIKREQRIYQDSRKSVTRNLSNRAPTQQPVHEPKTQPTAGKPIPVASTGHNHRVSIVKQPAPNRSAIERSLRMKSLRTDSSHVNQPASVHAVHVKDSTQNPTCTSKPNSTMRSASSAGPEHKKMTYDPVPKIRPRSFSYTSMKTSDSQHLVNKQAVGLKSTGLSACTKTLFRPLVDDFKQTNERERKQCVTNNIEEATAFPRPSNLAAGDTNITPHTPRMTADDRKKKLQEWLISKGKTYKRPPMTLAPKRPPTAQKQEAFNHSLWDGIEEEEELLCLAKKINQTLTECLELIEKGVSGEDIHTALEKVPEAKKFAKYWVCKARLLEREDVSDVAELYKQGVQCGAKPIDELRDTVFDIMKNTNKKTKVVTFGPLPNEDVSVENEPCEDKDVQCCGSPSWSTIRPVGNVRTPCTGTSTCDQGSAVKLQVASLSSKKEKKNDGSGQGWKRLTPVRRSVRIHHSAYQYPDVVQEHDHVVSSLDELLEVADADTYLFMRNDALPEGAEHILGVIRQDTSGGQNEEPV
ncbi:cytoskeleton-associated protein 2-like [Pseudophryne corroboree]|uniref:cytoskeleton-associated protein 2-like n=1 Tax=Pseudophryne corroboree TaxID=495146 RepID=UPI0030812837